MRILSSLQLDESRARPCSILHILNGTSVFIIPSLENRAYVYGTYAILNPGAIVMDMIYMSQILKKLMRH